MENFLKHFPESGELLSSHLPSAWLHEVNGHIHTPYSFSAFSDVAPIFEMATKENIKILGINDFYTTGGYPEFYDLSLKNKVFPLFNIEFIALDRDLQKQGIRVNDPNNPGRTYFSGKGLDFPETIDKKHAKKVQKVMLESLLQVKSMIEKTNLILGDINSGLQLDYDEIKKSYAREMVRERHIAKALRIAIFNKFPGIDERKGFLTLLYGGREPSANLENNSAVEIEIRNNMLKAGGRAFIEEDENAFLSIDAVIGIIQNAGGIPCYPVLLDDSKGNITNFEADKESLLARLSEKNIFCIELIPGRNDAAILENFVNFFHTKGFIILLGTEHNTPDMAPLTVSCRHLTPLSDELKRISFNGACVIAAHQYLRSKGMNSQVSSWNKLMPEQRGNILKLGKAVVYNFLNNLHV